MCVLPVKYGQQNTQTGQVYMELVTTDNNGKYMSIGKCQNFPDSEDGTVGMVMIDVYNLYMCIPGNITN